MRSLRSRGLHRSVLFPAAAQKVHVTGMSCCSIVRAPVAAFRDAATDGRRREFSHVEAEEDCGGRRLQSVCRDEVKEFRELVDVLSLALRREWVVSRVVIVVRLPIVRVYENL
jgi:hypothetical protein